MRRHVLPTPDSPAPRHTGLREPRLGQEEPSTQPESLSSHSSLRAAGLQDLSEEGRSPPPRTSRRWGVVRSWAGGHLLLHMPGLVIVVQRHAFWDSSELLWFLSVVLGGLGDGDQRRNNVFFLHPGWVSAIFLADSIPSDTSFLHASGSFSTKAKRAQPQPTGVKQVLYRFGHRDLPTIALGRWQSQ